MEYGYSVLMFVFSGFILIYAGLIALGNYDLIRRMYAVKTKDKKEYARRVAVVLALVSLSPFLSGLVALIGGGIEKMALPAIIVLIVSAAAFIALGIRIMRRK